MNIGMEGRPSNNLDYLNKLAGELSETKARELRIGVIALTHEVFSVFVKEDATSEGDRYIDIDFLASPGLTVQELQDVLTYQLVRSKERAPGDSFGADRIQIALPIPDDFHLGKEPSDLPDVDQLDEVYVKFEKDREDGVHVRRFVISRGSVYEYVAPNDPDRETEMSDILGREMHYFSTDTQNLNMLMVAQLIEDHKNFARVPQIASEDYPA